MDPNGEKRDSSWNSFSQKIKSNLQIFLIFLGIFFGFAAAFPLRLAEIDSEVYFSWLQKLVLLTTILSSDIWLWRWLKIELFYVWENHSWKDTCLPAYTDELWSGSVCITIVCPSVTKKKLANKNSIKVGATQINSILAPCRIKWANNLTRPKLLWTILN